MHMQTHRSLYAGDRHSADTCIHTYTYMHSDTHIHVHIQVKATQVIAAPQATASSPMAAISVNEILEVRGLMCSMEGVDQGLGCSVQAHGGGHLS